MNKVIQYYQFLLQCRSLQISLGWIIPRPERHSA